MTSYLNASTRNGGSKQIVVPGRRNGAEVQEAPFDDVPYVRLNGEWAPGDFPPPDPPVTLLPKPITYLALNGSVNVTATSWINVGTSKQLILARAVMMLVTLKGLPMGGASTYLRALLAWSGDTSGNSYALLGSNWSGCISGAANTARDDASVTFPLVVNAGTTTFQVQARRESGTATCSLADTGFTLTPIAWADHYEP